MSSILESLESISTKKEGGTAALLVGPDKTKPPAVKPGLPQAQTLPKAGAGRWVLWLGLIALTATFAVFAVLTQMKQRELNALILSQKEVLGARLDLLTDQLDEANRTLKAMDSRTETTIGRLDYLEQGFAGQRKFFDEMFAKQSSLIEEQRGYFESQMDEQFNTLLGRIRRLEKTPAPERPAVSAEPS